MRAIAIPAVCVLWLMASGCWDMGYYGPGGPSVPYLISDEHILGPSPGPVQEPPGGAPALVNVNGQVTFESYTVGPSGLELPRVTHPARHVLVEAVSTEDYSLVLRNTHTDAAGNYALSFTTTTDYYLRVRAQSGTGNDIDRVIHCRTKGRVVHAATSTIKHRTVASVTVDFNVHVTDDSFDNSDIAGALAILDTIRRLRQAAPTVALGPLDVFWARFNFYDGRYLDKGMVPGSQTELAGPLGNPTIYLLGGHFESRWGWYSDSDNRERYRQTDADQYDETVIAHEWASFLQLTQSRDNNFGGPHGGEQLLPTAAYGEGVVTAIGCALLDQRVYRDTLWFDRYDFGRPTLEFEFDCESGLLPGTGTGYGSEFVVARVVWDILDGAPGGPADFDGDGVAVDMADFMASFTALRTRAGPDDIIWLPSLLQQLIDDGHLDIAQANGLMQPYGEQFPPAGGALAFPELALGGPAQTGQLNAFDSEDANPVLGPSANAVFRLVVAADASVAFDLSTTAAAYDVTRHYLQLSIHDLDREIVALNFDQSANKSLNVDLLAGTYLVRVQHRPADAAASESTGYSITAQ